MWLAAEVCGVECVYLCAFVARSRPRCGSVGSRGGVGPGP